MKKKLAVSAKAARILRKVAAHILEEPRRLEMENWRRKVDPTDENNPPCGTVGCIAGWTCQLIAPNDRTHAADLAQEILGVSYIQRSKLFKFKWTESGIGWPERFTTAYRNAKSAQGRARAAARRIEHFIQTGE